MMTMQLLRPGAWFLLLSLIGSAEHRRSLKVIKKNVEDTGNAYRVYFDLWKKRQIMKHLPLTIISGLLAAM